MSEIRNLTRNGETFYPLTCTEGLVNRDGNVVGEINDIFDISEYNASGTPPVLATYSSLSLALAAVPQSKQKGGMTIRYVQTSDNKYVQYRLMADSFNTTLSNWQGVDDEPIVDSKNLVESGGVAKKLNNIDLEIKGVVTIPLNNYTWSQGCWASTDGTTAVSSNDRVKIEDFIELELGQLYTLKGINSEVYTDTIYVYDANKSLTRLVGNLWFDRLIDNVILRDSEKYIRLSVRKPSATFTPSNFEALNSYIEYTADSAIIPTLNRLENEVDTINDVIGTSESVVFSVTSGFVVGLLNVNHTGVTPDYTSITATNDTAYAPGVAVESPNTNYKKTNIIQLVKGTTYKITAKGTSSVAILSEWTSNGNFVKPLIIGDGVTEIYYYKPIKDIYVKVSSISTTDIQIEVVNIKVEGYNRFLVKPFNSILFGKSVAIIGDSYVQNANDTIINNTWHAKLASKHEMLYYNYGRNGNAIVATNAQGTPIVGRYTYMLNDADYVIVDAGKNDYNAQISISDFKTGLATLCNGIVNKYPTDTKICFFTPWRAFIEDSQQIPLVDYVDAIVEVCGKYSIPVFDASRYSNMFMYNEDFRTEYAQASDDVSHLNAKGHQRFLNCAEEFITSL